MADEVAKQERLYRPSHVSVITGADIYLPIVDRYQVPVVVSGFEPKDGWGALDGGGVFQMCCFKHFDGWASGRSGF